MKSFNWQKFIEDAEFVQNTFGNVAYIQYLGIEIHPSTSKKFQNVGAYKFDRESPADKEIITEIEAHSFIVNAIINAFQRGFWQSAGFNAKDVFCTPENRSILEQAFEKGRQIGKKKFV